MIKRIGIYSGTFDPVHYGHIAFALAAIEQCGLDSVVFLPEPNPRGKKSATPLEHRAAMLRLACQTYPRLSVLILSDERFTVAATLPHLQAKFPDAKLILLFGTDVATRIAQWPNARELLDQVELAIGLRHGDKPPDIPGHVAFIKTDHSHVAASHVRNGQSQDIVPAVSNYIKQHKLYEV